MITFVCINRWKDDQATGHQKFDQFVGIQVKVINDKWCRMWYRLFKDVFVDQSQDENVMKAVCSMWNNKFGDIQKKYKQRLYK